MTHTFRSGRSLTVIGTIAALSLMSLTTALPGQAQSTDAEAEATETETTTDPTDPRFTCQVDDNGEYTVMYTPESQPDQTYPWATPGAMGGGWSAERRCTEISRRLEAYRPDGLVELQTSMENGYNTVCVTTEDTPGCRIVFTVPQGQNATATRDRVFDNIASANSGQETTAVTTLQGGDDDVIGQIGGQIGEALDLDIDLSDIGLGSSSRRATRSTGLNLKPFLDASDRGTGTQLRPGVPNPRLNPADFR